MVNCHCSGITMVMLSESRNFLNSGSRILFISNFDKSIRCSSRSSDLSSGQSFDYRFGPTHLFFREKSTRSTAMRGNVRNDRPVWTVKMSECPAALSLAVLLILEVVFNDEPNNHNLSKRENYAPNLFMALTESARQAFRSLGICRCYLLGIFKRNSLECTKVT